MNCYRCANVPCTCGGGRRYVTGPTGPTGVTGPTGPAGTGATGPAASATVFKWWSGILLAGSVPGAGKSPADSGNVQGTIEHFFRLPYPAVYARELSQFVARIDTTLTPTHSLVFRVYRVRAAVADTLLYEIDYATGDSGIKSVSGFQILLPTDAFYATAQVGDDSDPLATDVTFTLALV